MRRVLNQLGRVVSVAVIIVLLAAPTTKGAGLLRDRDGDSAPILGPINRLIHAAHSLQKWISSGIADEMVVPRP